MSSDEILRLPQVMKRTGLPVSSLYRLMDTGQFPRPIHLSERAVGWESTSIEAWLEQRRAERDARIAARAQQP
jgi:prophage regulatory protein